MASYGDIVELLVKYVHRVPDPNQSGDEHGDPILMDMRRFIGSQLIDHSGFMSLWGEFEAHPDETQDELIGALESFEEGKPDIGLRLQAYYLEYMKTIHSARQDTPGRPDAERGDPNYSPQTGDSPGNMVTMDEPFYEGTYIYANVERGTETDQPVGAEASGQADEPDFDPNSMQISEVPTLFNQVYEAIRDHPDLDNVTRSRLGNYLRSIEAQVELVDEADRPRILSLFERIQSISPDIAQLLSEDDEFSGYLDVAP